ncbi:pilus assembly protein [Streptomyces sp. Je 1-79]|uniref:TadE/TadG family type IV pilus assembly protein n=1 Tax=Streptomyces sp. Je 1-79 TaxID=2943847 RepID=UPI0021A38095|nr:TadE/TadG family type IV pilus assembly protein [Streptomyces sp. Je 1-79]MCT4355557.1 pilus assembly protein [Streptomyces sp. Je 1-79]
MPAYGRATRDDRGQVAIEFLGMVPLILITLAVLWQCVLVGYTFTLAGNAADEAARAGAVGGDCQEAGRRHLGGAWSGAEVACPTSGDMVQATVKLKVPVLIPGVVSFPFPVTGEAGAVKEDEGARP